MRRAGNKNYPGQTAANNEIESVQYCAEDQTEDEVSEVLQMYLLVQMEPVTLPPVKLQAKPAFTYT